MERKMIHQKEVDAEPANSQDARPKKTSKKVSDHLANERTFLAWIRTGLATIAFGFVVERLKGNTSVIPYHLSSFFGVCLTVLGVIMMIVALLEFLNNRLSIDAERFHPS